MSKGQRQGLAEGTGVLNRALNQRDIVKFDAAFAV